MNLIYSDCLDKSPYLQYVFKKQPHTNHLTIFGNRMSTRTIPIVCLVSMLLWAMPARAEVQKDYFGSGVLKVEKTLKNGRQDGPTRWYYKTGKLELEENYTEGVLHGVSKVYYENGNLKGEMHYKNGLLEGSGKTWHENGQLMESVQYVGGPGNTGKAGPGMTRAPCASTPV